MNLAVVKTLIVNTELLIGASVIQALWVILMKNVDLLRKCLARPQLVVKMRNAGKDIIALNVFACLVMLETPTYNVKVRINFRVT